MLISSNFYGTIGPKNMGFPIQGRDTHLIITPLTHSWKCPIDLVAKLSHTQKVYVYRSVYIYLYDSLCICIWYVYAYAYAHVYVWIYWIYIHIYTHTWAHSHLSWPPFLLRAGAMALNPSMKSTRKKRWGRLGLRENQTQTTHVAHCGDG